MSAKAPSSTSVTQTALGSVTGAQALTLGSASETWATATLTGDVVLTVSNLAAGHLLKLFVTQDSTGGRALTVSNGTVSSNVGIQTGALQTSAVTVFTPDGSELVIAGSGTVFAPNSKTASYTLLATDARKTVEVNSSSATAVTVPADASASFNVGDTVEVVQLGTGAVTIAGEAGVSIVSISGNRKISGRYGRVRLYKRAASTWLLTGDLIAATSFDPTGVTGLTGWYKADALALADGAVVGTWTDSSSAAHDATQATASKKPLYRLAGRNGLPCVRFDGSDDVLSPAGITNNTAARTISVVAAATSVIANAIVWELSDTIAAVSESSGAWAYKNNAASAAVSAGGSITDLTLITVRFNSTSSADLYRNGTLIGNFDPLDGYQSGGLQLAIGAAVNGFSNFAGDVCEMLVYNAALSGTDRTNLDAYLVAKWGL